MCLVIDANTIGKVFDRRNADHERFKPVAIWVTSGDGSVIYGGTKYLKELGRGKYLGLYTELFNARRAVRIDTKAVDTRAATVKSKVKDKAFNDAHIVALVGLSRCCLVCTDDIESLPYLKRKDLYPDGVKVPHIYRHPNDSKHCCAQMVVEICPRRIAASRRGRKPKQRPRVNILNATGA
jgi:hypothetical protein